MLNLTGVWAPSAFVFYPKPHESQKLKSYNLLNARKALPQAFCQRGRKGGGGREAGRERTPISKETEGRKGRGQEKRKEGGEGRRRKIGKEGGERERGKPQW